MVVIKRIRFTNIKSCVEKLFLAVKRSKHVDMVTMPYIDIVYCS